MFRNQQWAGLKDHIEKIKILPWIPIIAGAGIAVRLNGLTAGSLWYDEIYSLAATRLPFFDMIKVLQSNLNPPGWEIILWFVTRAFGRNIFSSHLVSFLASVTLIWVGFRLSHKLRLSYLQQIGTMVLICFLPFQFFLAQEGRVYALYSLIYALGIIWAIKVDLIKLTISMVVMLWLHNTAIIYVPTLLIIAFLNKPKKWKSTLISLICVLIFFIPRLPVLLNQSSNGIAWFLPLSIGSLFDSFYEAMFAWSLPWPLQMFVIIFIVICLAINFTAPIAYWILYRMRDDLKSKKISWLMIEQKLSNWLAPSPFNSVTQNNQQVLIISFLLPIIFFTLIAVLKQNLLYSRTISPLLVPFYMILTIIFLPSKIKIRNYIQVACFICILFISLSSWTSTTKGGNIEYVTEMISAQWEPGDIIYHASGVSALIFWYYLPNKPQFMISDGFLVDDLTFLRINMAKGPLDKIPHTRAWVVWWTDPNTKSLLRTTDWKISQEVKNCSIASTIYTRKLAPIDVYLCSEKANNEIIQH